MKVAWIPNILSGLRIMIALFFPLVHLDQRILYLTLALLTEYLDGALARKYHWESSVGQMLDPIADRVLALLVAWSLISANQLLIKPLLFILSRDFIVSIGVVCVLLFLKRVDGRQSFRPNIGGKLTTALQYLVFYDILIFTSPHLEFMWATGIISFISGMLYLFAFLNRKNDRIKVNP